MKRSLAIVVLIVLALGAYLWPAGDDREPAESTVAETASRGGSNAHEGSIGIPGRSAARQETHTAEPRTRSREAVAEQQVDHGDHGHAPAAPPRTSELARYLNENPISQAEHEVVEAWGGPPGSPGTIGLNIVVPRGLSTAELELLIEDLRREYRSADVFSTRIYDSEEAATYDRHIDGGALQKRHLVAQVVRDVGTGVDEIKIYNETFEP